MADNNSPADSNELKPSQTWERDNMWKYYDNVKVIMTTSDLRPEDGDRNARTLLNTFRWRYGYSFTHIPTGHVQDSEGFKAMVDKEISSFSENTLFILYDRGESTLFNLLQDSGTIQTSSDALVILNSCYAPEPTVAALEKDNELIAAAHSIHQDLALHNPEVFELALVGVLWEAAERHEAITTCDLFARLTGAMLSFNSSDKNPDACSLPVHRQKTEDGELPIVLSKLGSDYLDRTRCLNWTRIQQGTWMTNTSMLLEVYLDGELGTTTQDLEVSFHGKSIRNKVKVIHCGQTNGAQLVALLEVTPDIFYWLVPHESIRVVSARLGSL